ncbi:hypothetical protein AGMMS49959_18060 [Planctomycetales bacterium]|nr:hypothetical protein AGMMS49959_18060 [Planctomycetales bacterium]
MKQVDYQNKSYLVVREYSDFGVSAYDLAAMPSRLWADEATAPPMLLHSIDPYQTQPLASPAELLTQLSPNDNWQALSRRSLARWESLTLFAEDPQRRLEVRPVETLAHQASLIRHILDSTKRRVLLADEVGLGKTVEIGLIIKELLAKNANLRVLYLAPAKLVGNVGRELDRLELGFRQWKADSEGNADFTRDARIIASIHRAAHQVNFAQIKESAPWDIIVIDECHHLSDWGGTPSQQYLLAKDLLARQNLETAFVFLLSGTPHQVNGTRFKNLLKLLLLPNEPQTELAGRVIFRTKDDVRDWDNLPLFPPRQVNPPLLCEMNANYATWLDDISGYFDSAENSVLSPKQRFGAQFRRAQALQWAASSPNAGLGYLTRQALRDGGDLGVPEICAAVAALRPYRQGAPNEPVEDLFARLQGEIRRKQQQNDNGGDDDNDDQPDYDDENPPQDNVSATLRHLLKQGTALIGSATDKWNFLWDKVVEPAHGEKIVFFAQPIETVLALATYLERRCGQKPALIIGGQDERERENEVDKFRSASQFLISSKAGGEGINLQFCRRLVHLDVPWNPMDMEQRAGRVHRFGSRDIVIVDTLVLRGSREEKMYARARARLKSVARTMVSPDKFEQLFSRVMSLIAPNELQDAILAPDFVDATDSEKLAKLVVHGFEQWENFNKDYASEQKRIQQLPVGLSKWEDLEKFLVKYGGATPENSITVTRFQDDGSGHIEEPAKAVRLTIGKEEAVGLVADYGGRLISKPGVEKFGLNKPAVAQLLRDKVFPAEAVGAAHFRWGEVNSTLLAELGDSCLLYAFLRQRLQFLTTGGAEELGIEIIIYYRNIATNVPPRRLPEEWKKTLFSALREVTVRARPDVALTDTFSFAQQIEVEENRIADELSTLTPTEQQARIRYAVRSVLCAHAIR